MTKITIKPRLPIIRGDKSDINRVKEQKNATSKRVFDMALIFIGVILQSTKTFFSFFFGELLIKTFTIAFPTIMRPEPVLRFVLNALL